MRTKECVSIEVGSDIRPETEGCMGWGGLDGDKGVYPSIRDGVPVAINRHSSETSLSLLNHLFKSCRQSWSGSQSWLSLGTRSNESTIQMLVDLSYAIR